MQARATTLEYYLQGSLLVLVIISGGILPQSVPRTTPILSPSRMAWPKPWSNSSSGITRGVSRLRAGRPPLSRCGDLDPAPYVYPHPTLPQAARMFRRHPLMAAPYFNFARAGLNHQLRPKAVVRPSPVRRQEPVQGVLAGISTGVMGIEAGR